MHKLFIDFIPVILFFIAFKLFGIYAATVVGISATALLFLYTYFVQKKMDKQQLITLIVFLLFGGMTLYFHNPIFVKWKPSIVFWSLGFVLFISLFIGKKTLIQRMIESALQNDAPKLNPKQWGLLNCFWTFFLISLGVINIYIAYHFTTETWVNFKVFGILGLILVASVAQAIFLMSFSNDKK